MLFLAIAIVIAAAFLVQVRIYKKKVFLSLEYTSELDSTEVTVGDDLYMYEELTNNKLLPIPYVKVSSALPEGLAFRLSAVEDGRVSDRFTRSLESMFVLKGQQKIRRRWRISCKKRGMYTLGDVTLVSSDMMGFLPLSKQLTVKPSKSSNVTVLPKSVDLERDFSATHFQSGEMICERSLLTDPMLRSGVREYTPLDPMNKINWKLTASHGDLMVNVEEHIRKHRSNVILNMCSQIIERGDEIPENPEFIEYNITVAATLLERMTLDNIPVRLIANTFPDSVHPDFIADDDDEVGRKMLVTPPFLGKNGLLDAMRTLAILPMRFSMPSERMLDYIIAHPELFVENCNLIFVTAVFDGRMLVFHREMQRRGIEVIFYVTTSHRGVSEIPEDVKIYYRTYFDSYKVGDAR